jgi:type II secretory pathway pseudopilin PulG
MKINRKKEQGLTLIEVLISMGIFVAVALIFASFQSDVFKINNIIQVNLNTQQNVSRVFKDFVREIRSATISNIGAYPISTVATSSVEFYSDIDEDGLKEKIRYFLDDGNFKKGTIKPSGDPLSYDPDDEDLSIVVSGVVNSSESIFEYYNASTTALTYPIDITEVTMIEAKLILDQDPDSEPGPIETSTKAMFRNLKD